MATTNHRDVSSPKPPHSSCLNIRGNKSICLALATVHMCMFVYTCVYVYQCIYICMCIYIYIHICACGPKTVPVKRTFLNIAIVGWGGVGWGGVGWGGMLTFLVLRTWYIAMLLRSLGSFTTLHVATLLRSLGSFTTLHVATLLRSLGSFTTLLESDEKVNSQQLECQKWPLDGVC